MFDGAIKPDLFLPKPFRADGLSDVLRRTLEQAAEASRDIA